jgi:hypothetical protein
LLKSVSRYKPLVRETPGVQGGPASKTSYEYEFVDNCEFRIASENLFNPMYL